MKYISFFLLLILIFTSCSKHTPEVIAPIPIEIPEPIVSEIIPEIVPEIIPGLIPDTIIRKAEKKYNRFARNRYKAYNSKLRELQNASDEVKLETINRFFNKVPFVSDKTIWGQSDYWATPLEFLGKDKGDCEDYVFAKYFSLLDLGIEREKLYLSFVSSTRFKKAHLVLSYFKTPYSTPLILDSINYKIFPANKRKDLKPLYNFNGQCLYRAKENGQNGQKVINNKKVDEKWEKLLNDIRRNKL